MRSTLPLWLTLALAACPNGPAHADPFAHTWCRLPTAHFEIITDLKRSALKRLALQMEVFRVTAEAYIQSGGKAANIPLKVIVFRDRRDFRNTMKAPRFSGFMQPSLREARLIIGPQQANKLLHETALHEYTHYLLRNLVDVHFPVWYDEGLAAFLSSMSMTKHNVIIGKPPLNDLRKTLRSSSVDLRQMAESENVYEWESAKLNDFYLMAWAVVHFIELGHDAGFADRRAQLDAYLRAGTPSLEAGFDTSYEEFESTLQRYMRLDQLPTSKLPLPDVSLSNDDPQCLDDQDRDYTLATTMMDSNPQDALTILQTLHADYPTDVRYLIGLASVHFDLQHFDESVKFAEQALTLAPHDSSAQIELATRLVHGCVLVRAAGCAEKWARAVALFRSGVRQDPDRFDAVLGLGLSYLHSGRPGDALNYLRIAYQKAPWAPQINFYLGECYRLIGDRRAAQHLTNARNWAGEGIWHQLAEAALAELD